MPRFSVIIPAYNEAATVEKAVRRCASYFRALDPQTEIIVVDDGSTDQTSQIVEQLKNEIGNLQLIRHQTNQGKGAAVASGVLASHGDWIVFLDADLSTAPEEFTKFLPCLDRYDILMGSRTVRGARIAEHQPLFRVLAGKLFNAAVRLFFQLPYFDTQCGFKAFAAKAKPLFQDMRASRWAFDVEILYRARRNNLTIREVPVVWEHRAASRVRLADFWNILKELGQIKTAKA